MKSVYSEVKSPLLGKLLVSAPDLGDPRFSNAMVLIIEHSDMGSIGLIINRPTLMSITEVAPEWDEMVSEPGVVFAGGPVDHDALITLGRGSTPGELALGAHSVDLDDMPSIVKAQGVSEIRIFSGYAGWVEGQLEDELADQGWWVIEPTLDDLFCADPASLWADVMSRQPEPLNWYANFPHEVRLN